MEQDRLDSARNKRRRRRGTPLALRALRLWFGIVGRIAPAIASRKAYRLWFETRRFGEPARETRWLDHAQQETLPWPGGPLASNVWGGEHKATVLLVHGWNGRGSQMGAFAEPLRAAGYRVVAYDLPAHGRSPGNSTNIFEVIDTLNHATRYYGPVRAIVSHSFGAVCAMLAVAEGLPVERLVCVSPPNSLQFMLERFCRILAIPPRTESALARRIEQNYGKTIWDRVRMDAQVPRITIPGLVLHDENDYDVTVREGETIARAWRAARFVKTRGLGHRRILRDSEVIRTVTEFINAPASGDG